MDKKELVLTIAKELVIAGLGNKAMGKIDLLSKSLAPEFEKVVASVDKAYDSIK